MRLTKDAQLLQAELNEVIAGMDEAEAEEFLAELHPAVQAPAAPPKQKSSQQNLKARIGNILFYLLLVAAVVLAFFFSNGSADSNVQRTLLGYSAKIVLTGSMRSVMPEDTLILIKSIEPSAITAGDDITFFQQNGDVVTHRVIEVIEQYGDTGKRGFKTKGTDNPNPDKEIVGADNVIGKVIFHSYAIGAVITWIRNHIFYVVFMLAAAVCFFAALKVAKRYGKKASV